MMDKADLQKEVLHFQFENQNLIIDSLKALFWREQGMLIVADLHFGKAGHFRKSGVPVPRQVHISDFQKLNVLISKYEPETLVFLGDLFHSEINDEWNDFIIWSNHHSKIRQVLVEGNHDILHRKAYEATSMELVPELVVPPFHFTHKPYQSELFNLAGHIHPAVRLYGRARQVASFPCFYFGERFGLFPAFGTFTGSYKVRPKKGDRIFALTDHSVIALVG